MRCSCYRIMFDKYILLLILLHFHGYHNMHVPHVNETELKLAFFVHRHGDRTPIEDSIFLSNNPAELIKLSEPYGFGQLTQRGIETSYKLGQFIRKRYDSLLSSEFKPWERYVRATFSPRTVTTAILSLAASYGMDLASWTDVMNWKLLPYYTVIPKYDYNLAFINCPAYINASFNIDGDKPSQLDKFKGLFEELSAVLPFNISKSPLMIYGLYDLYVSQTHLGLPLGNLEAELLSQIKEAANVASDIYYGNKKYISLQAGVLLNEFIKSAGYIIAGGYTFGVQQYSAHDFNVYSFEAVTQVTPRQGYPEYGSMLALELRWDRQTDIYYVLPVYLSAPDRPEKYLQVKGCGKSVLCEFTKFVNITSKYSLDTNTWRKECGFREDTPINAASIE